MRAIVELARDTAEAIERLRREDGRSLSEVVNELIRHHLARTDDRKPFIPRSQALGLRIDISDVADALEFLEGIDEG